MAMTSRRQLTAAGVWRRPLSCSGPCSASRRPPSRDGTTPSVTPSAVPQPVQPHVPILIGGNREKVTLRLVAQYGDLCNVFGTPDEVRQRLEVLRAHRGSVGRPYEEITRTHFGWPLIGRTADLTWRLPTALDGSGGRERVTS